MCDACSSSSSRTKPPSSPFSAALSAPLRRSTLMPASVTHSCTCRASSARQGSTSRNRWYARRRLVRSPRASSTRDPDPASLSTASPQRKSSSRRTTSSSRISELECRYRRARDRSSRMARSACRRNAGASHASSQICACRRQYCAEAARNGRWKLRSYSPRSSTVARSDRMLLMDFWFSAAPMSTKSSMHLVRKCPSTSPPSRSKFS
mmetsp:Transcript_45292/g.141979  ORF Transcript_45292/g.141979 Transcript_45292/m.141979 type:complete len:208 (-) Transcript_45292:714-1337(-)